MAASVHPVTTQTAMPTSSGQDSSSEAGSIRPLESVIVTKNYYTADSVPNTLQLMEDDVVYVLNKPNSLWWDGVLVDPVGNISRGWFPASHTKSFKQHRARSTHHTTSNEDKVISQSIATKTNTPSTPKTSVSHSIPLASNSQSPTSLNSNANNVIPHSTRRQSVRPIQKSHSISHSHFIPPGQKSRSNMNLEHTDHQSTCIPSQVSASTLKNSSSSPASIFKEKNYFAVSYTHLTLPTICSV